MHNSLLITIQRSLLDQTNIQMELLDGAKVSLSACSIQYLCNTPCPVARLTSCKAMMKSRWTIGEKFQSDVSKQAQVCQIIVSQLGTTFLLLSCVCTAGTHCGNCLKQEQDNRYKRCGACKIKFYCSRGVHKTLRHHGHASFQKYSNDVCRASR